MALKLSDEDDNIYVSTITISNSWFLNNTGPYSSAVFSSIWQNFNLVDVHVKGNTTTNDNGFIMITPTVFSDKLSISIINGEYSDNTNQGGSGGIYLSNANAGATQF